LNVAEETTKKSGKEKVAEDQPEPAAAAREAASEAAEGADDADSHEVERLIDEAPAYLGCSRHVAAGALHGLRKKKITPDEGKAAVKAWLAAPVK
jgi:hypothetical protein